MFAPVKYFIILFFYTISVAFADEDMYVDDNFTDNFLQEKIEVTPQTEIIKQDVSTLSKSNNENWSGIYAGGSINFSNKANFENINQSKTLINTPKTELIGYEKEFFHKNCNIIVGIEGFYETGRAEIIDTTEQLGSIIDGNKPTIQNATENATKQGLRLTAGVAWHSFKPYMWLGLYHNSYKNYDIISPKYNIEYGAGVDFALMTKFHLRIAYKFRNIKYKYSKKLIYAPNNPGVYNNQYNKVNYNSNDVSLDAILHF